MDELPPSYDRAIPTFVFVTLYLYSFTFAVLASDGLPKPNRGDSKAKQNAEVRVVDAETGLGVPLIELVTVNHLRFVTDNAGRIAFHEPGLMDREVYFTMSSHGYELKKDGFGFSGVKITLKAGQVVTVKIIRRNVAERLCRLTGEGRFRDTLLLGHKPPLADTPNPGLVAGGRIQSSQHGIGARCIGSGATPRE